MSHRTQDEIIQEAKRLVNAGELPTDLSLRSAALRLAAACGDEDSRCARDILMLVEHVFAVPRIRTTVPLKVRPMLVSGMLATDARGPVILLDSEQDPKKQVIALWHETLHLLGLTDEFLVDEYAIRLADACPDVLRRLAHNINVPDSKAPQSSASAPEGWKLVPIIVTDAMRREIERWAVNRPHLYVQEMWNDALAVSPEAPLSAKAAPTSEDEVCKVAANLLRNEIVRLEYPKSMIPQQAEQIGRRQAAFQAAIRFLDPPESAATDRGTPT